MTFIESDALWLDVLIHLSFVYVSDCAASVSGLLIKPFALNRTEIVLNSTGLNSASDIMKDTCGVFFEEIAEHVA